ncbi:MAG TPA: hypothetical protein PLP23_02725 [Panacibacter sp.]|nr:hypothetical protein [Panacibacter sp.]
MEKKSLEQKGMFETYNFLIDDAGLSVKHKKGKDISEYNIPYEKITANRYTHIDDNKTILFAGLIICVISAAVFTASITGQDVEPGAAVFWLVIGLIFLGYYFIIRKKRLIVVTTDNKAINFFQENPSIETVNEFINNLIEMRNKNLLDKYGKPNKLLEYSVQYDNLNWLLNTRAITKEIYEQQLQALNILFNQSSQNSTIGFR